MLERFRNSASLRDLALATALMVVSLPALMSPIWDADFWYHISTGRYMVEHRSLIWQDPFSFTTTSAGMHMDNLRGYWLGQIALYWAYVLGGGFYGVIALRVALFWAIYLAAYFGARRQGASPQATLILLVPAATFAYYYTGDRPQGFSLLFALLLILMLDLFRRLEPRERRWIYLAVPVLTALWANVHRGYPMGSALILVFVAGETIRAALDRKHDKTSMSRLRPLFLLGALGILATLINPNLHRTYITMFAFEGSWLQRSLVEYQSPFEMFSKGKTLWEYFIYALIAVVAVASSRRRSDFALLFVFGMLFAASLSAFRYTAFFVYCTIPYAALCLTDLIGRKRLGPLAGGAIIAALLLTIPAVSFLKYKDLRMISDSPVEERFFPAGAADFIKTHTPRGRMMNDLLWGGYLTWKLNAGYMTFVDTRTLNLDALRDYYLMLMATPEGIGLLDSYEIGIVVMRGTDSASGEFVPLMDYLVRDDRWRLAYYDDVAVVFIRASVNPELADSVTLPSSFAYNHIIARAAMLAPASSPGIAAKLRLATAHATQMKSIVMRSELERADSGREPWLKGAFERAFKRKSELLGISGN